MATLKRTPLFPVYQHKAKCIAFAGFELPVQFTRIQEEHHAVRERAGLFDVSHMGQIEVWGPDALKLLQQVTTNDVAKLSINQAQYTTMCQSDGGTRDDLIIYRLDRDRYWLVVNAINIASDEEWLRNHASGQVQIANRSDQIALLALQGPLAEAILQRRVSVDLSTISPFTFHQSVLFDKVPIMIARTGYTGEDGFELFLPSEAAVQIWLSLLEEGRNDGLVPCGLGARDTLRLEAAFPLYGQELSPMITPVEAGIGFVVNEKKGPFIGQEVLVKQKKEGTRKKLVGLEMLERGIPRAGYSVWVDGIQVGNVTSGTRSPTLQKDLALALLTDPFTKIGQELAIDIRGKLRKAKVVPIPFYRRERGK